MAVEPPATNWAFPDFADFGDSDLVAVGGDLAPGTVLAGYRRGLFPMHTDEGLLGWWSPLQRGVLFLDRLQISRSLRQSLRRFRVTFDHDLAGVIAGCADSRRPGAWINDEIVGTYLELGSLGWVHSVECWDQDGELAGGLYGVAIGALFAGESMFFRQRDASKVALVGLVQALGGQPNALLDVQWVTPHLESLGAVALSRERYQELLKDSIGTPRVGGPWREEL